MNQTPALVEMAVYGEMIEELMEKELGAAREAVQQLLEELIPEDPAITGVYFGRKPENPEDIDVFVCRGEERTDIREESHEGRMTSGGIRGFQGYFVLCGRVMVREHDEGCPGFLCVYEEKE